MAATDKFASRVREIICEQFDLGLGDFSDSTTWWDLRGDSLSGIELVLSFEEAFDVKISDDELQEVIKENITIGEMIVRLWDRLDEVVRVKFWGDRKVKYLVVRAESENETVYAVIQLTEQYLQRISRCIESVLQLRTMLREDGDDSLAMVEFRDYEPMWISAFEDDALADGIVDSGWVIVENAPKPSDEDGEVRVSGSYLRIYGGLTHGPEVQWQLYEKHAEQWPMTTDAIAMSEILKELES